MSIDWLVIMGDTVGRQYVRVALSITKVNGANIHDVRHQLIRATRNQPDILLIDMANVIIADSNLLGTLITVLKHVRSWGGKVALCSLNAQVKFLLEITSLERLFKICDSYGDFLAEVTGDRATSEKTELVEIE